MKYFLPGFFFAALWASASAATKFGLESAPPFVLALTRFMIAGGIMLIISHLIQKNRSRLPKGAEWKKLLLFGFLNTSVYLGAFVYAMKEVSPGIGSLSTATNPLFIMLISAIWLKRKISGRELLGIALGIFGVLLATYPLLKTSHASLQGLLILLLAMISVSFATVYYSSIKWELPRLTINAWQVFLGGLLLVPFAIISGYQQKPEPDLRFWFSVSWLALPVSILALQLWFYLVNIDAVKASLWLFLCPVFGFIYAGWLFNEPISWHTIAGTSSVLGGLWLANFSRLKRG